MTAIITLIISLSMVAMFAAAETSFVAADKVSLVVLPSRFQFSSAFFFLKDNKSFFAAIVVGSNLFITIFSSVAEVPFSRTNWNRYVSSFSGHHFHRIFLRRTYSEEYCFRKLGIFGKIFATARQVILYGGETAGKIHGECIDLHREVGFSFFSSIDDFPKARCIPVFRKHG